MQTLKDYSGNQIICYTSGDIVTTNLCSLVVQSLVKDSNYIYSPNVRISGSSLSIVRLVKLTSSVNSQIIFSQKESGKGISIETNASGYLIVNINGSTLFGELQLILNTVYAIGLSYNGSKVKLFVNDSEYESTFTSAIVESTSDMIINLTGQSGILFYTNQVYSDLQKFVKRIFYLATNYRISKNDGTLLDPVKGITVGNGYSSLGVIPDDTANFVYDAIPISSINDFTDAVLTDSEVHTLSDKYRKQSLSSLIITDELATDKTKLIVLDKNVIVFDSVSVLQISLVLPATGKTISYTRKDNGNSTYDHIWYKDSSEIDSSLASADTFFQTDKVESLFSVLGSEITFAPSPYVINELIIDDEVYTAQQIRSYHLADKIDDKVNEKKLIAGVLGFSNSIIYTVEEVLSNSGFSSEFQDRVASLKKDSQEVSYEDEA